MATSETPWEPPLAAGEVEHLVGALGRLRATFRWKADGLDSRGLAHRLPSSALSLGGLLAHLAAVEDEIFGLKLSGDRPPHVGADDPFAAAAHEEPSDLYLRWDEATERSRQRLAAALAAGGLDQLVHADDGNGNHANLRRLVCDLIEEYGRHTGHADLLREAVDGRVGEDPPPGWQPTSGPG